MIKRCLYKRFPFLGSSDILPLFIRVDGTFFNLTVAATTVRKLVTVLKRSLSAETGAREAGKPHTPCAYRAHTVYWQAN